MILRQLTKIHKKKKKKKTEIIARPAQLSLVPYQHQFPGETLKNQQSLA